MIYSYQKSGFDELLNKDGTVSIHHQNILKLGIEMFTVLEGGNPEIVNEILHVRNEGFYEFQQRTFFHIHSINTVFSCAERARFLGPKIWISYQMKSNALRI